MTNEHVIDYDEEEIHLALMINSSKLKMKQNQLDIQRIKREMLKDKIEYLQKHPLTNKYDCNGIQIRLRDTVEFAIDGKFNSKSKPTMSLEKGIVNRVLNVQIEIFHKSQDTNESKFYKRIPQNLKVDLEDRKFLIE